MPIKDWDTVADNNSDPVPFGAGEGQTTIADLNNVLRQIMADTRAWYEAVEWRDLGLTIQNTGASDTILLDGDQTAFFEVNQAIRYTDASSTKSGLITGVSFATSTTTITVSTSVVHPVTVVEAGPPVVVNIPYLEKSNVFTDTQIIRDDDGVSLVLDDTPGTNNASLSMRTGNTFSSGGLLQNVNTVPEPYLQLSRYISTGLSFASYVQIFENGRAEIGNNVNASVIRINQDGSISLNPAPGFTARLNGDQIAVLSDVTGKKDQADFFEGSRVVFGDGGNYSINTGFGTDDFVWGFAGVESNSITVNGYANNTGHQQMTVGTPVGGPNLAQTGATTGWINLRSNLASNTDVHVWARRNNP